MVISTLYCSKLEQLVNVAAPSLVSLSRLSTHALHWLDFSNWPLIVLIFTRAFTCFNHTFPLCCYGESIRTLGHCTITWATRCLICSSCGNQHRNTISTTNFQSMKCTENTPFAIISSVLTNAGGRVWQRNRQLNKRTTTRRPPSNRNRSKPANKK